ncbi:MAG TPA: hypothetical protein VKT73_15235 [Xanthobacteraceae bacterium]|nr:hypothetical protein [Xanthobacteraceae bacterium]
MEAARIYAQLANGDFSEAQLTALSELKVDIAKLLYLANGGELRVAHVQRMFVSAFGVLIRPANTTAYSANDSISNNSTAGNVIPIYTNPADVNDQPIEIKELLLETNDTGVGTANMRAFLFNADPTANGGVINGDNGAYSNKRNGFIGSMQGQFRVFSDGGKAKLTPDEGQSIITLPVAGSNLIYYQLQTLTGFTPSANSTLFNATLRGYIGRA